jgi:antitoxin ParD1/3/4
MTTMNISLPEKMKEFVDGRVEAGHYGTASEYVRDLIRKDSGHQAKDRKDRLDALLLEGIESLEEEGTFEVTDEYWIQLQERIKAGVFRKEKVQSP